MMTVTDEPVTTPVPGGLDAALRRLSAAVTRLQAAVERRGIERRRDRDDEAAMQQDDRARLTADRDAAQARAARMAGACAEALSRLDKVEATVRSVAGRLDREAADGGEEA